MKKLISKLILKALGWRIDGTVPSNIKKSVIIAAPHTSNWDFFFTKVVFYALDLPLKFTIKNELNKPVVGALLKSMGAIFIDRTPKQGLKKRSMVDSIADEFSKRDELHIIVTPEGTRKYVEKWKTGFYWVADKANVPIIMGFIDYKDKVAGIGSIFNPSGDIEEDMKKLMAFYRTKTGKYPELGVR